MKLSFGILCLVAAAYAVEINIIYPDELFSDAFRYQNSINDLQSEIFKTISELRVALSTSLKKVANSTLLDIENDVVAVLGIDKPYRTLFFETNSQQTICLENLRNRLNYETEFTGFKSGICLAVYDNEVNKIITETYSAISIYDNELSQFELSVIEAFSLRNVWTQPDDIRNNFVGSYNKFNATLADLKEKIGNLSFNIDEKVGVHAVKLNECYANSQAFLGDQLKRLEGELAYCVSFDRL